MSLQENFMKIANTALNTNLSLIERYKEDSAKAVDDMYRNLAELRHAEAHMAELTDSSRLQLYFDRVDNKLNDSLKTFTKEFTQEVTETYSSYDNRMKNLFLEEGVGAKDIYNTVEIAEDNSVFQAKAENMRLETNALTDLQSQIYNQSNKAVKKRNTKRLIFGIIIPLIISLVVFSGFHSWISSLQLVEVEIEADGLMEYVVEGAVEAAEEFIGGVVGHVFGVQFYVVFIMVIVAVWLVYYTILAYILKKKLITQLGLIVTTIYNDFTNQQGRIFKSLRRTA